MTLAEELKKLESKLRVSEGKYDNFKLQFKTLKKANDSLTAQVEDDKDLIRRGNEKIEKLRQHLQKPPTIQTPKKDPNATDLLHAVQKHEFPKDYDGLAVIVKKWYDDGYGAGLKAAKAET